MSVSTCCFKKKAESQQVLCVLENGSPISVLPPWHWAETSAKGFRVCLVFKAKKGLLLSCWLSG